MTCIYTKTHWRILLETEIYQLLDEKACESFIIRTEEMTKSSQYAVLVTVSKACRVPFNRAFVLLEEGKMTREHAKVGVVFASVDLIVIFETGRLFTKSHSLARLDKIWDTSNQSQYKIPAIAKSLPVLWAICCVCRTESFVKTWVHSDISHALFCIMSSNTILCRDDW